MKNSFFISLGWAGIKKNKKLYLPYILTCVGTVMMCYIISFLSTSPVFANIKGGSTVQGFLGIGVGVMAVFSVIFLFYSNSFLIRRRKKEFGLYNILGLDKKNLALVLFVETAIIALITILGGLFLGILFSKLAELCVIKVLNGTVTFAFTLILEPIVQSTSLFAIIFLLIYLNTVRQIQITNPIQLIRSENIGERPPKGNWVVAIIGVILLAWAYYLSVTINDPVTAITIFFVAVVMVIIATYMLFISGSVTLCRILQKNKRYYYKTNHFVSVSSMTYRMKRNGAGLASICILCTMVLVMVSSTVCLYVGAEDNLRNRYPRNINIDDTVRNSALLTSEQAEQIKRNIDETVVENGTSQENILSYRTAALGGIVEDNRILYYDYIFANKKEVIPDIWQVFIVPLSDYNQLMGTDETLSDDEVMIYTTKDMPYKGKTLQMGDGKVYTVKKLAESFVDNGIDSMQIFPTIYVFVPDFYSFTAPLDGYVLDDKGQELVTYHWYYGFDLPCSDDMQIDIQSDISDNLDRLYLESEEFNDFTFYEEGSAMERADFYAMYAGLLFLGVLLGTVFIFAAVLIIYYKQVSEGYEDQSRFGIMQRVGMTKKEIRKSINSQVMMVFFIPLIIAGIHLMFAFPLINRVLMLLGLSNISLLILVTAACYLVFVVFYIVVYKLTSNSYFAIVSGMRSENE